MQGGQPLGDERAQGLLVQGIDVGVEETDGDRLIAVLGQSRDHVAHRSGQIERREDRAIGQDAFRDLEATGAIDDRFRLLILEIVDA